MWQSTMSLCNVQQGGQIRPVTDFLSWYNSVNVDKFREKVGGFQLGQQVTDELNPFHTTVIVPLVKVPGRNYSVAALPANYEYLADVRIIAQKSEYVCGSIDRLPIIDGKGVAVPYTDPDYAAMISQFANMGVIEKTINMVDAQRWGACLDHKDKGPTVNNPKATQDATGIKVAPVGVAGIVLDYFRTPRNATFAYTISNDIVIYDPANSQQLEWTNVIRNEFLVELVKKYASFVGDNALYAQYDNNKSQLK